MWFEGSEKACGFVFPQAFSLPESDGLLVLAPVWKESPAGFLVYICKAHAYGM